MDLLVHLKATTADVIRKVKIMTHITDLKTTNFVELDSIIVMSKIYPLIIRYSSLKGLNPDKPRYLRKITSTY